MKYPGTRDDRTKFPPNLSEITEVENRPLLDHEKPDKEQLMNPETEVAKFADIKYVLGEEETDGVLHCHARDLPYLQPY